jgi:hypothetical protein
MAPYIAMVGEFRVHYAGFFDPGFGHGVPARGVLEVRCHEAPFVLEHGQVVGRLVYERMAALPEHLYGADLKSELPGPGPETVEAFPRALSAGKLGDGPRFRGLGVVSFAISPVRVSFDARDDDQTDLSDRRRHMSIKTLLAALVLTAAPGLAMAECSWGMEHQTTMSCAEGTSWDASTQTCVPVVSS